MKIVRWLACLAAAASLLTAVSAASQSYPSKPIRLIVSMIKDLDLKVE